MDIFSTKIRGILNNTIINNFLEYMIKINDPANAVGFDIRLYNMESIDNKFICEKQKKSESKSKSKSKSKSIHFFSVPNQRMWVMPIFPFVQMGIDNTTFFVSQKKFMRTPNACEGIYYNLQLQKDSSQQKKPIETSKSIDMFITPKNVYSHFCTLPIFIFGIRYVPKIMQWKFPSMNMITITNPRSFNLTKSEIEKNVIKENVTKENVIKEIAIKENTLEKIVKETLEKRWPNEKCIISRSEENIAKEILEKRWPNEKYLNSKLEYSCLSKKQNFYSITKILNLLINKWIGWKRRKRKIRLFLIN